MVDSLILIIVGLLLWGGHWMRWQVIPILVDDQGELHRPLAYGYGCLCILIGFALWSFVRSGAPVVHVWAALKFLVLDMAAAGLGTMLPRGVRWIQESQALRGDKLDYEQTIEKRRETA